MILVLTVILIIILISRATEELLKIPTTLALIFFSYVISLLFPEVFNISEDKFDEILHLMLPIILLPDILNLSLDDLKKNSSAIFFLAFISVIFSITLAIFIFPYILPQYQFTLGMLITLFSMLMATDAITVSSIFSKFNLPEKLKIYAESESLFNDVTALIIFYFIALPLISGGTISPFSINIVLLKVLVFSVFIGVSISFIGYILMKILVDTIEQFIVMYLVVIISFLLAEHLHVAGILAIIASVVSFKIFLQKEMNKKKTPLNDNNHNYKNLLEFLEKVPAITKREFRTYKKEAYFIGIFANAVVFIAMVNMFKIELLAQYYREILIVFALTTLIRFIPINALTFYYKLPQRWSNTLVFAGTKGGLTIIMAHSIPDSFVYKELFVTVVIGIIILSTFLYTFFLIFYINKNKDAFEEDKIVYKDHKKSAKKVIEELAKEIKNVIEIDPTTKAFKKMIIEKILIRETSRAQRYKLDLSLMAIELEDLAQITEKKEFVLTTLGIIVKDMIRDQDTFGQLTENKFLVITANTTASGATILGRRILDNLEKKFNEQKISINIECGITEVHKTDDIESLMEKIEDALENAKLRGKGQIEIEI